MSILESLNDKKMWEKFLEHKKMQISSTKKEISDLCEFIEQNGYQSVVDNLLLGGHLSHPTLSVINKKSSSKKRKVFIFSREENYVLKLLSFLLHKYDFLFSRNLYSFRKNTCVKEAVKDIIRNNSKGDMFCYKVDISDYFNSVDTDIILNKLKKVFSDDPMLFSFFEKLLADPYVYFKGELIEHSKGIMAGVPVSGFLANLYLSDLDKWFENNDILYARYSDDIVVIAETEEKLSQYEDVIKSYLESHGLKINEKKQFIVFPNQPLDFLGFKINGSQIDISDISFTKIKAKLKRKSRALYRWKNKKKVSAESAIRAYIRSINKKFYGHNSDDTTWSSWYFPTITTTARLNDIDKYAVSCIRYIASGKYTKSNYNLRYETIKKLGFISLVNAYYKYRSNG